MVPQTSAALTIVVSKETGWVIIAALGLLTAFCWFRVWYKPSEAWMGWAVLACCLTVGLLGGAGWWTSQVH